jgi:hypothetical protein
MREPGVNLQQEKSLITNFASDPHGLKVHMPNSAPPCLIANHFSRGGRSDAEGIERGIVVICINNSKERRQQHDRNAHQGTIRPLTITHSTFSRVRMLAIGFSDTAIISAE